MVGLWWRADFTTLKLLTLNILSLLLSLCTRISILFISGQEAILTWKLVCGPLGAFERGIIWLIAYLPQIFLRICIASSFLSFL